MDGYLGLKTVHILGVILFIGNIIVTGWWKVMADRTGDPRIIAFAQHQVALTDWAFTFGGVVLVVLGGVGNLLRLGMPPTAPWIMWGSALFAGSGVIWVAVLIPLQTKLGRMAAAFAETGDIPQRYWRLEGWWLAFGALATLLPLAAVPVMVFKFG